MTAPWPLMHVGDSLQYSEEIVTNLELHLSMRLSLLLTAFYALFLLFLLWEGSTVRVVSTAVKRHVQILRSNLTTHFYRFFFNVSKTQHQFSHQHWYVVALQTKISVCPKFSDLTTRFHSFVSMFQKHINFHIKTGS